MKFGCQPARLTILVCCVALLSVAFGVVAAGGVTADGVEATADGISTTDANSINTGVDTGGNANLVGDSRFVQQEGIETDRIRIDIELQADGSATWTIEFWSTLDDDDSTAAFDSLAEDIAADPESYTADFADRIDDTVDTASQSTSREMSADEFSVETERQSLGREYGIVRYSFEWTGFAQIDGDTLQAGDAIDGLFLDDGSRLLVSWPDDYELQSATPEPDDERANAVLWRGDSSEFLTGEPRLAVSQPTLGIGSGTLAISLAIGAIALGVTGWLLRRRSTIDATPLSGSVDSADSASTPPESATESAAASTAKPTEPTSDNNEAMTTGQPDAGPSNTDPDPELLSNEEQVLRLLESNGGRMKQQTVVGELGWTDAKTSKVVGNLREDGELESFRIGRENVLRILGEDSEGTSL